MIATRATASTYVKQLRRLLSLLSPAASIRVNSYGQFRGLHFIQKYGIRKLSCGFHAEFLNRVLALSLSSYLLFGNR
jgi:hypothetical protein